MKITTWNVNGIRSLYAKGLLNILDEIQPDIFCAQEVKAQPDQLPQDLRELAGYHCFWLPAEKPGYSGVSVLSREAPETITYGLGIERFDLEGRVIDVTFPQFHLLNIYFPSGQRGHDRVDFKLDFYAHVLERYDRYQADGIPVIITGDFNTAHDEIDLARPKANQQTSGFLPEERVWIDHYLDHGLVDVFRWLYPERSEFTWWTYRMGAREKNIGWRLDYFLMSKTILGMAQDVIIHKDITGSDHCPVTLKLGEMLGKFDCNIDGNTQ
jgi:exodeoxyribonuclease-3